MKKTAGYFSGVIQDDKKKFFTVYGNYYIYDQVHTGHHHPFNKGEISFKVKDFDTWELVQDDTLVHLKIIGNTWGIGKFDNNDVWNPATSYPFTEILQIVKHKFEQDQRIFKS